MVPRVECGDAGRKHFALSLADSKCPINGSGIIVIRVTENCGAMKGMGCSMLDPSTALPSRQASCGGSGSQGTLMDMEAGLPLLWCPLLRQEAGCGDPGCPRLPQQGGRALWGLADGQQAGTGSPRIVWEQTGAGCALSSVPALAARQGSC